MIWWVLIYISQPASLARTSTSAAPAVWSDAYGLASGFSRRSIPSKLAGWHDRWSLTFLMETWRPLASFSALIRVHACRLLTYTYTHAVSKSDHRITESIQNARTRMCVQVGACLVFFFFLRGRLPCCGGPLLLGSPAGPVYIYVVASQYSTDYSCICKRL